MRDSSRKIANETKPKILFSIFRKEKGAMRFSLIIFILIFEFFHYPGCKKSTEPISNINDIQITNENVYYYLSDSTGSKTAEFLVGEDIFFHFGIINNQNSGISYTKGHGGPIASFIIFNNDSIIGYSDDGYVYTMEVVRGKILSTDTLQYSVSWYSNPIHTELLESGSYYTTVGPSIWFDDFDLSGFLDTLKFEVK